MCKQTWAIPPFEPAAAHPSRFSKNGIATIKPGPSPATPWKSGASAPRHRTKSVGALAPVTSNSDAPDFAPVEGWAFLLPASGELPDRTVNSLRPSKHPLEHARGVAWSRTQDCGEGTGSPTPVVPSFRTPRKLGHPFLPRCRQSKSGPAPNQTWASPPNGGYLVSQRNL